MLIMMQTRQMLVQGFSLDSVFRHEGLVLNDEDIEAACHAMNPQVNPKRLRQELEQNGRGFVLRETAERLKANKYLVDHANITYTD
jgi:trigger factor